MSTNSPVPRDRLGEVAYQGLWWAIVALPALVVALRVATTELAGTFFLYVVIGLPATVALQVIAGLLAWTYRRRQWRHFLGRVASVLSFVYYGLWALLALAVPETAPGRKLDSLAGRLFGDDFADGLSATLFVLVPLIYLAMLGAIWFEGNRAVRYWDATVTG